MEDSSILLSPFPALRDTGLLSVFPDLSVVWTSHMDGWNSTARGFLCLQSSLNIMLSRPVHVATDVSTSVLSMDEYYSAA